MNTFIALLVTIVAFPCIMHAMQTNTPNSSPMKDSRKHARTAKFESTGKKVKQRKIVFDKVVEVVTVKKQQKSQHIILEEDFAVCEPAKKN